MTETIILAIITGVVTLLTALIGKLSFDVSKTKKDTAAVHQSINNRPTSLSDRLDGVLTEVHKVQKKQKEHSETLEIHSGDIGRVRRDISELRDEDQDLRSSVKEVGRKLSTHTKATAEWTPMLTELHTEYVDKRRGKKSD